MKETKLKRAQLLGRWQLCKHGFWKADGIFVPTAKTMAGLLIYAQDDSMSVLITKDPNPKELSDLIVYSGRFSVEPDGIYHHIDLSPDPNRIGHKEHRIPWLENDILTLKTPPSAQGYYEITWQRICMNR